MSLLRVTLSMFMPVKHTQSRDPFEDFYLVEGLLYLSLSLSNIFREPRILKIFPSTEKLLRLFGRDYLKVFLS